MSKQTFWISFAIVAVVAILVLAPDSALASGVTDSDNVGQNLRDDIVGVLQGNLGVVAGLAISLFGLWLWLAQQSSWGLLIVIAGAALTAFPGIYEGLANGFKSAFDDSVNDSDAVDVRNGN